MGFNWFTRSVCLINQAHDFLVKHNQKVAEMLDSIHHQDEVGHHTELITPFFG